MKSKKTKPPILFEWLIKVFFPDNGSYSTVGDMQEQYSYINSTEGLFAAKWWYTKEMLKSIIPLFTHAIYWGIEMLLNYLKLSFRNLTRYKLFSFINIIGLALGLTCTILIFLFVQDELSYDSFHENGDRMYRVISFDLDNSGNRSERASRNLPLITGPELAEYYPEIESYNRQRYGAGLFRNGNELNNEYFVYTDPNFFTMFSFELLAGNPETCLSSENSIVLTKEYADKYFAGENPLNKEMAVRFGELEKVFTVSAIAENLPSNSTIFGNIFINVNNLRMFNGTEEYTRKLTFHGDFSSRIYLKLAEGSNPLALERRIGSFINQYFFSELDKMRKYNEVDADKLPFTLALQKLENMHLDSFVRGASDIQYSYILSGIALIVLLIACINFVNISLARFSTRFKEIGVRKLLGAVKSQLVKQFWSESVLITSLSLLVGLLVTYFLLPTFNEVARKNLSLDAVFTSSSLYFFISLALIVGIAAGSFPALIMSRLQPAQIIRGVQKVSGKSIITKSSVVIQFALSVFLLVSTYILSSQINYMLTKDLGFQKNGIMVIELPHSDSRMNYKAAQLYKNEINNNPGIKSVSYTNASFAGNHSQGSYCYYEDKQIATYRYNIDYNYLETMGIKLFSGRMLSEKRSTDTAAIIVNKAFVKEMGIDDPLNKVVKLHDEIPLTIVGVIKDINFQSLADNIMPAIFYHIPSESWNTMLVNMNTSDIAGNIDFLKSTFYNLFPAKPFEYSFLDEDINSFYRKEKRWNTIITASSVFALLIACMGIFALTSISVVKRTKEIGVRKVLGASTLQMVNLVTREFVIFVVIANLIAWPFAYYVMNSYLADYVYRISIDAHHFIIVGILSLITALTTVFSLTFRASRANPVDSLKVE